MEPYPTKKVSRRFFLKKMRDISRNIRFQIENFIYDHDEEISRFEFGRVPGHRTYKIVLKNGTTKEWSLSRL